jgi:hypothetical protein
MRVDPGSIVLFNNLIGTFGHHQVEEWIERALVALEKIAEVKE